MKRLLVLAVTASIALLSPAPAQAASVAYGSSFIGANASFTETVGCLRTDAFVSAYGVSEASITVVDECTLTEWGTPSLVTSWWMRGAAGVTVDPALKAGRLSATAMAEDADGQFVPLTVVATWVATDKRTVDGFAGPSPFGTNEQYVIKARVASATMTYTGPDGVAHTLRGTGELTSGHSLSVTPPKAQKP